MNKTITTATGVFFTFWMFCVVHLVGAQGISTKRDYSGFFDSYYYRGPLSFTGGIGTSLYSGNLAKSFYGSPGLAFSLGANYKVWPRTIFGAEFQYLSLAGSASGVSFKGTDWGVNLYGRLYLIDDIIRKSPDRRTNKKIKPYICDGLGFIHYTANVTPAGRAAGITPTFPLGIGVEFKISQRLQVIPEFTQTFTLNSKLDGVATKSKDGYGIVQLKIQYSPFAPKKKKKVATAPADPNQHREEHQEWRKKKEQPKPVEETPLPGENENKEEQPKDDGTGTEEQPKENENPKSDTNTEEKPAEK